MLTLNLRRAQRGGSRARQGGRRSGCTMYEYEYSDGLIVPMKP
jgi:hypothetical protein